MNHLSFKYLNKVVPLLTDLHRTNDCYSNLKLFLKQKYKEVPKDQKWRPLAISDWMEAFHYKDRVKFMRKVEGWLSLTIPIPLKFLEFLNTDYNELLRVLEFDKAEYRAALNVLPAPKYFQYRATPCVYPKVDLPENFTEEEDVIDYVMTFMRMQKQSQSSYACIYFGYLKTIYISSKDYYTEYHEPTIYLKNDCIICKKSSPFQVSIR